MSNVSILSLNNGVKIPQLGLGVWQIKDGEEAISSVSYALKIGYRSIDTAAIYGNEKGVGEAIKSSKIARNEIFVTSKLWNSDQGYESSLKAFDASLSRLGLDYLDLYLIHWPSHNEALIADTWRAFEKLYKNKRLRAIGVSNFKVKHLENLLKTAKVKPMVNQIELHPYKSQIETREFCTQHSIQVESWSPLMHGGEILSLPLITEIASKHHKTVAQVVLRWHVQNGLIVIPKSVRPGRIKENFEIFDFNLSETDMKQIDSLDRDRGVGPDPDSFAIRLYSKITKITRSVKRKNPR